MNGTTQEVPNLTAYFQDIERTVKLTTEASEILYGQGSRQKHIITNSLCHLISPPFTSKGNHTEQL